MKKIKRNPNRWIFTKEKLPKESKWYLVQNERGYITTDYFSSHDKTFLLEDIVAWIEVPTPLLKGAIKY